MNLVNFAIHRNTPPPMPETPFRQSIEPNDLIVTFTLRFDGDEEAKALSFTSDVMKEIDQYRGIK